MCVLYSKRSIEATNLQGLVYLDLPDSRVQSLSETHDIPNTSIADNLRSNSLTCHPTAYERHFPTSRLVLGQWDCTQRH